MAEVSNFEIGNKNWENWFMSKSKYENSKNCESYGVSNGRTIRKLPIFGAKFWFSKFQKILEIS